MKVVKESNKRDNQKKRRAMEKGKKPFRNAYGMDAQQLRNSLIQTSENHQKKIVREFHKRPITTQAKSELPKKEVRDFKHTQDKPHLLIDPPSIGTNLSIEYPTPDWFKFQGQAEVSVIVPLYKSHLVIRDLINSWHFEKNLKVEIIFVDDCCPSNTKDTIVKQFQGRKEEFPYGIGKIIYNTNNKGYGRSCNTGADYSSGDYIIYLNADTRVTENWIQPIIEVFKNDSQVGIVGNLQLKDGGQWHDTIDGAGSEWTWESGSFVHIGRHSYNRKVIARPWKPEKAPSDILTLDEREIVTGCCLAIRSDLNKEIGGFNPNFRVGYWEDSDLCLTVREKGWKVMFQPDSVIYHKLGHTNSGAHKHQDFNRNYFWNKWVVSERIDPLVKDQRTKKKRKVKSILLQRKGANGDVLVASYVAKALKEKYPGTTIGFYTHCEKVLKNNPYIDKVYTQPGTFSERQYQLIYNLDMAYEYRPYSNILETYADVVGVEKENCQPFIAIKEFAPIKEDFVVIHAGKTSWVGRDWSKEGFAQLSKMIQETGKKVVCVGTKSDHPVPCQYDFRGKTNINELASVIQKAKFFIGIDSFPFHVCQAVNTPGICYFGSILPETRIYRDNMKAVSVNSLPCIGCHHRRPKPSVVTNYCENNTLDCVNQLTVQMFWDQLKPLL